MRFMMLLPCPLEPPEKLAAVPDEDIVLAMRKYNEEMKKAGVFVLAEGLHATSKGFRLKVSGGKKLITGAPFTEAKEVIAGFWIIQVKSTEEALPVGQAVPFAGKRRDGDSPDLRECRLSTRTTAEANGGVTSRSVPAKKN